MRERRGSKIFLTLKSEMIGYIIILNEIAGYIFKQMYLSTFLLSLCVSVQAVNSILDKVL